MKKNTDNLLIRFEFLNIKIIIPSTSGEKKTSEVIEANSTTMALRGARAFLVSHATLHSLWIFSALSGRTLSKYWMMDPSGQRNVPERDKPKVGGSPA